MTTIAPGGYRSPGRRESRAGFECGAAASMIGADAGVSVDVAR